MTQIRFWPKSEIIPRIASTTSPMADLGSNLVLICENKKKNKLERDRATEERELEKRERDWEDKDLEKRESYREREREHERREKRELTEERAYWWVTEALKWEWGCSVLDCFTENLDIKQLDLYRRQYQMNCRAAIRLIQSVHLIQPL